MSAWKYRNEKVRIMNTYIRFLSFLSVIVFVAFGARGACASISLQAETNGIPVQLASLAKEVRQADIYLLLGQSNMRGRGEFKESDFQFHDPRILMLPLNGNQLSYAKEPIHDDGSFDLIDRTSNIGVGPGLFFARHILPGNEDRAIVLVPGARGGSWIALWRKGNTRANLYDEAVRRAQLATELLDSEGIPNRIAGILWLQGESDATEGRFESYEARLNQLIEDFRNDLGRDDLPFMAATIGSFIHGRIDRFSRSREINEVLLSLPQRISNTACVDARHLAGHIGDHLHYNRESQENMGALFAQAMRSLIENCSNAEPKTPSPRSQSEN